MVKPFLFLIALLIVASSPGYARDPAQVHAFRKTHACPGTGKFSGACKGYVVDHIVPLCWGGADDPDNMEWQETANSYKKDIFERRLCKSCRATGDQ